MDSLVNEYINAAIEYSTFKWNHDPKEVNFVHNEIISAFKRLKNTNKLFLLRDLLQHENKGVVLWASTHLLLFDEVLATNSLKRLIAESGQHSFSAEMVLKEWKNGSLTLDYPDK